MTQGLRYTEDGFLGATYFSPAVVVPALVATLVVSRLAADASTDAAGRRRRAAPRADADLLAVEQNSRHLLSALFVILAMEESPSPRERLASDQILEALAGF